MSVLSVTYIGPQSRTERPRKTKIGTEHKLAHVTRDWDATFMIKRSRSPGHFVLLNAVLAHQAAAVVGVGTCWPWETAVMLPSARRRFVAHEGRRGAGAYCGGRPPTTC